MAERTLVSLFEDIKPQIDNTAILSNTAMAKFKKFHQAVENFLKESGYQVEVITDNEFRVFNDSGFNKEIDMYPIAAQCALKDEQIWPELIEQFFSQNLENTEEDIDKFSSLPWEEMLPRLRLVMYPGDKIQEDNRIFVAKTSPFCPHLVGMVVGLKDNDPLYTYVPRPFMYLSEIVHRLGYKLGKEEALASDKHPKRLEKDSASKKKKAKSKPTPKPQAVEEVRDPVLEEVIVDIALEQTLRDIQFDTIELNSEGMRTFNLRSHYPYLATMILKPEKLQKYMGKYGALVTIPANHSILIYPIDGNDLVDDLTVFATGARILYEREAMFLTDQTFWLHDGKVDWLECTYNLGAEGEELDYTAPEEFNQLMLKFKKQLGRFE